MSERSITERNDALTVDAVIVKKITYKDMPTATRTELMGALEPSATMQQGDILDQLARVDSREREKRILAMTSQIRTFTIVVVILGGGALLASVVSLLLGLRVFR